MFMRSIYQYFLTILYPRRLCCSLYFNLFRELKLQNPEESHQ